MAMNAISEIEEILEDLPSEINTRITTGVLQHLERSVFHLIKGKKTGDDQYYTDALYRTNQAYEGILKEAYIVLTGKQVGDLTPYKLEKYFIKNKIFNDRVSNVFKMYRKEWRNPSTHNHNLFFKRDEAFLAISNVSAFIYILVSQIVEKVTYKSIKSKLSKKPMQMATVVMDPKSELGKLINSFANFNIYLKSHNLNYQNENQIMGALTAFLEESNPQYRFKTDHKLNENNPNRVDLLIAKDDEKPIITEIKNKYDINNKKEAARQVAFYLDILKADRGIVFYYSNLFVEKYIVEFFEIDNKAIYILIPDGGKTYIKFNPNCDNEINESHNISSITENEKLDFTFNFIEKFQNNTYSVQISGDGDVFFEVIEKDLDSIRLTFEDPSPDFLRIDFIK